VSAVWPRDGDESGVQATAPLTPIVRAREAVRTFIGSAASMFGGMCLRGSPLSMPSVLCVRVCCMLRGRPDAARQVQSALAQLSAADNDVLGREMEIDQSDRDRPIVLLEGGAVVRACDDKAFDLDFFKRSSPLAACGSNLVAASTESVHAEGDPESMDETRVRALAVALRCTANLYRVGRSTVLSMNRSVIDEEHADRPFELFCGNVLRVVLTQGRSSHSSNDLDSRQRGQSIGGDGDSRPRGRMSRTSSSPNIGMMSTLISEPASLTPPSTCELLQAAAFGVQRATPDYAHLAIEVPVSSDGLSEGHGLHPDSDDLLSRLRGTIAPELEAAAADAGPEPMHVVLLSATGDAFAGDELALVLARALTDLQIVQLRGVVLPPRGARLARGVLDALGMTTPVAVGSDLSVSRDASPSPTSAAAPMSGGEQADPLSPLAEAGGVNFLARDVDGGTAASMLLSEFDVAAPLSLTLLVTTSLTDVASFVRAHRTLFAAKARRVVLLGNVDASSLGRSSMDAGRDSYLRPDESSANFKLDLAAATFVFRACQELRVQLVVLPAVYDVPLPSFVYDELATLGHPVALRLRESQRASLQSLWHRANLPPGHSLRRGLPSDVSRTWFARTFCGGADLESVSEDRHIWPYVCEFTFLDPLALLACHPATLEAFYDVTVRVAGGVEHLVIGASSERSGVRDCAKLRSFILDGCRHALNASLHRATSGVRDSPGER